LFRVKKANFLAKFFGENIFKIITSVPDWANFHPLGGLFTLASGLKIAQAAHIFVLLVQW
jgi:hypothetical protein